MKKILWVGVIVIPFLLFACAKKDGDKSTAQEAQEPSYWAMSNLRMRAEPSTDAAEITTVQKGEMVSKIEDGPQATISGITANWVQVRTETGETGWCFGGYLADNREEALIIGSWIGAGNYQDSSLNFLVGGKLEYWFPGEGAYGTWSIQGEEVHCDSDHPYVSPTVVTFIDANKILQTGGHEDVTFTRVVY